MHERVGAAAARFSADCLRGMHFEPLRVLIIEAALARPALSLKWHMEDEEGAHVSGMQAARKGQGRGACKRHTSGSASGMQAAWSSVRIYGDLIIVQLF